MGMPYLARAILRLPCGTYDAPRLFEGVKDEHRSQNGDAVHAGFRVDHACELGIGKQKSVYYYHSWRAGPAPSFTRFSLTSADTNLPGLFKGGPAHMVRRRQFNVLLRPAGDANVDAVEAAARGHVQRFAVVIAKS
jgi:hypothetical protein